MKKSELCLAVIPARGGSKGLPGKNIRPLLGMPLLAHSLRCAERVPGLRVVVSTDDEEIAATARAAGGDVPFMRPSELAQDDTPMMPVLSHALAEMEKIDDCTYGSVLLLDPTSPGRTPEDIKKAFELLATHPSVDGVMAVSKPRFNPFWVGVVERNDMLEPAIPGAEHCERRQDVPPFYRINGALYLWRRDFVARAPERWRDGRHVALHIPEERAFSIDDRFEFELAELLLGNGLIELPWLAA